MDEVGTSREGDLAKDESSSSSSSSSAAVRWRPRNFSFSPYSSAFHTDGKPRSLTVVTKRPAVARLTKDIVETYKICNPDFHYAEELNPKRFLTSPSVGSQNDGYDNANSDLILAVNCVLVNLETKRRYIVKDILGHGTFGQVAKCWVAETNSFLAVKIIKNQPAYYQQALVEVSILTTLNKKYDPEDRHHIVRIHDYFVYLHHLCITFELLGTNLFELIKITKFQGLSLSIVQLFSRQILEGLSLMKDAGIIHCDLKPENILLCTSGKPAEIKIIDFGSACMEDRTVYSYIQSRYYRSPEVLLGYKYTTAIDMWSFGCIVAELFLGIPLFPGASEFDLLRRMIRVLGGQPPDHILKEAKNTSKFFKFVGNATHEELISRRSSYQPLTLEEYEARELNKPSIAKEYFKHTDLKSLITKFRCRTDKEFSEEDMNKEAQLRLSLYDFLGGLLEFDPAKRWSPLQASKHPFMTGEPFTCPYRPPPESPRMPVSQNMRVDHHPAGGHWFAAGLSPNISGRARASMHNSPQYQMMPYGYSASYGSLGSHGSYNESTGLGSSYGSYGDNNNMHAYFSPVGPSGMNGAASILGSSPEARRRMMQFQPGNGLGVSPSAGNFAPMSLGTSPSQFTPPSSYGQVSGGSPGHYGPTSPARGNCHGSPLGKVAAAGQFNRRKGWAHSGSLQSQESSLNSHWQGQATDGSSSGQPEGTPPVGSVMHLHSNPNVANRKQQRGSSGITSDYTAPHNIPNSLSTQSFQFPRPNEAPHDMPEGSLSLPDPGDWDPNYSEELLLQEDGSDVSSMTSEFNRVHLGQSSASKEPSSSRRYNRGTSYSVSPRANGPIVSPPSGHDMHNSGYSRPLTKPSQFPPHLSHISPSRLGQQQPAQRFNNNGGGRSATGRGSEWNHVNIQPPPPTFNSGGPHSPGSGYFSNDSWGRRGNIPPPASRGRKDYGRIT